MYVETKDRLAAGGGGDAARRTVLSTAGIRDRLLVRGKRSLQQVAAENPQTFNLEAAAGGGGDAAAAVRTDLSEDQLLLAMPEVWVRWRQDLQKLKHRYGLWTYRNTTLPRTQDWTETTANYLAWFKKTTGHDLD